MKSVMSIASSDSSGGAGIQADIKTILSQGLFATTAIVALTAQNTTGVFASLNTTPEVLQAQIKAIIEDIPPDSTKIGLLPTSTLIEVTIDAIKEYHLKNVVVDPVMVATSGATLMESEALGALKKLLPLATVITPNIREAIVLSGRDIKNKADTEVAARVIYDSIGTAVLCKGGHTGEWDNRAGDYLYTGNGGLWIYASRIDNPNTHGTGCTLSSSIAVNLAKRYPLDIAIHKAKDYVSALLNARLNLGRGSGPLDHSCGLSGKFIDDKGI